jgi:cyclic pyranopterin phosphate synthase
MLYDAYGRPLENLRIAVTRECNYRCIFCHLEGDPKGSPLPPGSEKPVMRPEDYEVVARAASILEINSFKITGGEPLIRGDIVEVVRSIREGAPSSEISMTTNGYLLAGLAARLREAGLDRVNISIHSTRREIYRKITGVDGLKNVLQGLRAAVDVGFSQIKINAVVLTGLNDRELWDLVELARSYGAILQLIELHPVGLGARGFRRLYTPLQKFERELLDMGASVEFRPLHNRPVYKLPDGVVVEVVRPFSNPVFCAGCRRVRLLADGTLSPCLNWRGPRVDLVGRLRRAESFDERVRRAAEALIEVNSLRRPFYLWPRHDGDLRVSLPASRTSLRLMLPKRGQHRMARG